MKVNIVFLHYRVNEILFSQFLRKLLEFCKKDIE